ncbi:MAG: GNAT family N-acetyltransferase [Spirulinaceae cyanobacterium]
MSLTLRPAIPADVPTIFSLIQALAAYENLTDQVTGTAEQLHQHLFGETRYAEAILAEWEGVAVGFALFFNTYSTFLTRPGLYLEDLFVLPDYRRRGIGRALLTRLGELALERQAGRLEWSVLDWNENAIAFYEHMGATVLPDWRICRVTGKALIDLANKAISGNGYTNPS